jgi:diadenosine tetraphosphate (Ap4A) HIT family hydrolase
MFELHERLAADTVEVTRLDLCRLQLMGDARWPWLILVPQRAGMTGIHQLAPADRALLIEEVAAASDVLEALCRPDRINVGALGNLVPQLHVHVIARHAGDPAWPGPVWGAGAPRAYAAADLDRFLSDLRGRFR